MQKEEVQRYLRKFRRTLVEVNVAEYNDQMGHQDECRNNTIPKEGWSYWNYIGGSSGTTLEMSFKVSGGEVRPRNMAIRIWKRTG